MRSSEPEVMKMCVILLQKRTLVDMHLTLPNMTVRNTCPLLSLHIIILEYVSDQFKTEVI